MLKKQRPLVNSHKIRCRFKQKLLQPNRTALSNCNNRWLSSTVISTERTSTGKWPCARSHMLTFGVFACATPDYFIQQSSPSYMKYCIPSLLNKYKTLAHKRKFWDEQVLFYKKKKTKGNIISQRNLMVTKTFKVGLISAEKICFFQSQNDFQNFLFRNKCHR